VTTEEQRRQRALTIALRALALGASVGTAVVLIGGMAEGHAGAAASTSTHGSPASTTVQATTDPTMTSQLSAGATTAQATATTAPIAAPLTLTTQPKATGHAPVVAVTTTAKPVITTTTKPPVTTTSATRVGG
jgi:hypothetical protein